MGAATSAAAHSMQKFAVALFDAPHEGHCSGSGAAHPSQNFAPAGFSEAHLEQRIALPGSQATSSSCITRRREGAAGRRRMCRRHRRYACQFGRHVPAVSHGRPVSGVTDGLCDGADTLGPQREIARSIGKTRGASRLPEGRRGTRGRQITTNRSWSRNAAFELTQVHDGVLQMLGHRARAKCRPVGTSPRRAPDR
jgi:hypothetical protein